MKPLPETLQNSFRYKQVRRNEYVALYRQTWGKNGCPAYEVVIPQIDTRRFIDGRWQESEPYETYPSTQYWGEQGWTFPILEEANKHFDELTGKAIARAGVTRSARFGGLGGSK